MKICKTITEKFEETWTETVETFVKKIDNICEDLPWPLDWVCHAVVTLIKIVTTIVHYVIKIWVTVVCYTVSVLVSIAGAIIGLILTIPILGTWVKALVGAIVWLWSQFVGLLDAGLGLIGIRPIKNLRLHVIILMRPERILTVPPGQIQLCLDRTADIFRRRADIKLTTTVHQVDTPSVKNALTVDTGIGLFFEDMGDAGRYFQTTIKDMLFEHTALFAIRLGAPVVAFIVDGVGDSEIGCSAGPAADYVCVEGAMMVTPPQTAPVSANYVEPPGQTMASSATTLAHEICHALGLAHDGFLGVGSQSITNLMFNKRLLNGVVRGDNLSPFQRAIIRSSPHVTYL
jgi:hypothetical protein